MHTSTYITELADANVRRCEEDARIRYLHNEPQILHPKIDFPNHKNIWCTVGKAYTHNILCHSDTNDGV